MFVHRNSFSKNAEADMSVSNDGQKHFDNKYLNAFEEQHRVKCEKNLKVEYFTNELWVKHILGIKIRELIKFFRFAKKIAVHMVV